MEFRERTPANCSQLDTPNELNEEFVRIKLQEWLRFPSIGDRRAAITKAREATFRWILLATSSMDDLDLSPTSSMEDSDLSSTPSIDDPHISPTPTMANLDVSPTLSLQDPGFSPNLSIKDPDVSPTPSMQDSERPGPKFVEWLRNGSGVYWIQGKMGCGKSTLMKYVTGHSLTQEYLLEWASGQTLHCPSYYFNKTGTSELQSLCKGCTEPCWRP